MRWMPLLLALAFLGGCADPAEPPASEETPADEEPGRTARGNGSDGDGDEEEIETRPIELLRTPLQMAGQGPESFDFAMPANITRVDFAFTGSPTVDASDLRIEVQDCGAYRSGMGFQGTTGGDYGGTVCQDAPEGPSKVTIAATLLVVDGTFVLVGHQAVA